MLKSENQEVQLMKQYGWGILGLGSIAKRFMNDLPRCPQARLAAVASRDPKSPGICRPLSF
jgi:predicted dehydrogenase